MLRQHRTRGGQRSTSDAPGGQGVEDNQGKHREALLRVLTNAKRADEQTEDEEGASQRSGERLERDLCSAEEALRQILGPAAATLPQMDLSNDRLWARTRLRPVLRRLCTRRVDRLLAKEEHKDGVRVSFQGIPADTRQQAIEYLQEAGICLLQDQVPQAKFSIHTKRGAARRTSRAVRHSVAMRATVGRQFSSAHGAASPLSARWRAGHLAWRDDCSEPRGVRTP